MNSADENEPASATALQRRLTRVERTLWALSALAALTGVSGLVLGTARPGLTQSKGSVIRAPLRVMDEQGQTVLEVNSDARTGARLCLLDTQGRKVAWFGATCYGGRLVLCDEDENSVVLIGAGMSDRGVVVYSRDGLSTAKLTAPSSGGEPGSAGQKASTLLQPTVSWPRTVGNKTSGRTPGKAECQPRPAVGSGEPAGSMRRVAVADPAPRASIKEGRRDWVRITVGGRYYHRRGCRRVKKPTTAVLRANARSKGRKACPTCRP